MKTVIFSFLMFGFVLVNGQSIKNSKIYGYYWAIPENSFFIIDSKRITRIDFCDICDFVINIDTASYTFLDDTLVFNFGLFVNSDDYFEHKWIYLNEYNRFIDDVIGEFIKIDKEVLDKKLKPFGLKLLDIEKREED